MDGTGSQQAENHNSGAPIDDGHAWRVGGKSAEGKNEAQKRAETSISATVVANSTRARVYEHHPACMDSYEGLEAAV